MSALHVAPITAAAVHAAPCAAAKRAVTDDELDRRLERAAVPVRAFTLLCRHNSDVRRQDDDKATLTYYHSTQEPPLTLAAYAERIARYSECGPMGVLLGLRLAGRCHATSRVTLTRLSAHRLVITGLTLGVKAHMDRFRSNKTVAKAGGLQLRELNGLEYAFFKELEYRAVVTQEELTYMEELSARALAEEAAGRHDAAVRLALAAFCDPPLPPKRGSPRLSSSASSLQSLDDDPSTPVRHSTRAPPLETATTTFSNSFSRSLAAASMASARAPHVDPGNASSAAAGAQLRRFGAAVGMISGPASFGDRSASMAATAGLLDLSCRSETAAAHRFTRRVLPVWHPHAPLADSALLERSGSVALGDLLTAAAQLQLRDATQPAVPRRRSATAAGVSGSSQRRPQGSEDGASTQSPQSASSGQ